MDDTTFLQRRNFVDDLDLHSPEPLRSEPSLRRTATYYSLENLQFHDTPIELIRQAKKSSRLSRDLQRELSPLITHDLEAATGLSDLIPNRFYLSWNELSSDVALSVENSLHSEMICASRYVDFRSAESAVQAARKGCTVQIIHSSRADLSTKLQLLGNVLFRPKALSIFRELSSNPNVAMLEGDTPFSFMVLDMKNSGIEIIDPNDPGSFFFGVNFEDQRFALLLKEFFNFLRTDTKQSADYPGIEEKTEQVLTP